jgi:GNAT superfamily N-acetyltransferase
VRIDDEVSEADERTVVRGLLAFNEKWLGPSNEQPVRFVARDELGVVGGLLGHTRWSWLYVAKLWVDERGRGQGIGTKLLAAAEELARTRGCTDASLDTFEYHARPFPEKLGY